MMTGRGSAGNMHDRRLPTDQPSHEVPGTTRTCGWVCRSVTPPGVCNARSSGLTSREGACEAIEHRRGSRVRAVGRGFWTLPLWSGPMMETTFQSMTSRPTIFRCGRLPRIRSSGTRRTTWRSRRLIRLVEVSLILLLVQARVISNPGAFCPGAIPRPRARPSITSLLPRHLHPAHSPKLTLRSYRPSTYFLTSCRMTPLRRD